MRLGLLEFNQTATPDPEWLERVVDKTVWPAYALDALIASHFTNMRRPTAPLGQTPWTEEGLSMAYLTTFLKSLQDTTPGNERSLRRNDRFSSMGIRTIPEVIAVMCDLHKIRGVPPRPQGDDLRQLLTALNIAN